MVTRISARGKAVNSGLSDRMSQPGNREGDTWGDDLSSVTFGVLFWWSRAGSVRTLLISSMIGRKPKVQSPKSNGPKDTYFCHQKPDPVAMRMLVKPKAQSRTDFGLWTLDYLGWNCANCSLTKFRTVCLSLSETPAFARLTEKAVNQCSATGR